MPAFTFLPLGATLQSFKVNGLNIVQGFHTQEQYVKYNTPYFGSTIGRVANRLSGAQIKDLNGKTYPLADNNKGNTLHGGVIGWGKRIWDGPKPVGVRSIPGIEGLLGGESVEYKLVSEDGDEGFPGTVEVRVVYTSGTQKQDGKDVIVLGMEYEVTLVEGEETLVNMTNHSYFNLSGDATTDGTTITLATNQHLPVDNIAIPTGPPTTFPIDTTVPFTLSESTPIDHCFTLSSTCPIDTRTAPLKLNLSAHKSGRHLEVLSTEPAFQFYTGGFINVPAVEGNPARGHRAGFCCEPGRWVNAGNVPEWKSQVVLRRGEVYGSRIVYRAWAD